MACCDDGPGFLDYLKDLWELRPGKRRKPALEPQPDVILEPVLPEHRELIYGDILYSTSKSEFLLGTIKKYETKESRPHARIWQRYYDEILWQTPNGRFFKTTHYTRHAICPITPVLAKNWLYQNGTTENIKAVLKKAFGIIVEDA